MSPSSEEKRHYVSVMQHTLHAVRTADRKVEFCGECALREKDRVQQLLQAWSEGASVSSIVAITPEPAWWHLGDSTEARTLHTDADVRRFAERLPHRWRGPLEMMACNAADGSGVSPDGDERWLLGVTQGDALAAAGAAAIEHGIVPAALGSATLDSVAAAVTAVQLEGAGSVQLWAIGHTDSYVFTVSVRGIEAVDRCDAGFDAILAAVQQGAEARTVTEATEILFAQPMDSAAAARLASVIAPQLQGALGAKVGADPPASFACTGLTDKEAWFGRAIAHAVDMPYWQPNLSRYLDHLQLERAANPGDVPSLSLLGTLHLAAIHRRRSAAWHPSWGLISRTGGARRIRREINFAVAPAPSPSAASVSVAETAEVSKGPRESPPADLPATPTNSLVPPRNPAPVATQEANGESKTDCPPPSPSTSKSSPEPRSPPPTPVIPTAVPVMSAAKFEANDTTAQHPSAPAAASLVFHPHPPAPSPRPSPVDPAPALAVQPVSIHAQSSRADYPASDWNRNRKPPPPHWTGEEAAQPFSEPGVSVPPRRSPWPVLGIVLALFGVGLGWKFYLDAETVRTAAEKEKRTAEQMQEMAEREIAAAVAQVRRASEQAAQAEQRARQLAAANAREVERVRGSSDLARQEAIEKARQEAIEQGRREAMEQARREATEQARREAIDQARREAEEQTVRIVARELAAARAAAAPGSLKIASVPAGADVFVDDRRAQRAPASIEGLPPGRHAVRLMLAGHVPQELTVDVVASKTTDLGPIKLERAIGAVAVSSTPADVEFRIRPSSAPADAAPVHRGRTPAQLENLPTGEYVVQFSRAGWPDRTERVNVGQGATARVATTFQGGTVVINSSPTGATVRQGQLWLGKTPLTLGGVPPQDTTYELSAPGYEPLKMKGTVAEGRELELNGTLLDLNRLVNAEEVRTPPRPYETPVVRGRLPRSAPPYITVSLVVLPNGSPEDIRVLGKVDPKLARKSVEAIAKWKFFPGVSHAGYPVRVRMNLPVRLADG